MHAGIRSRQSSTCRWSRFGDSPTVSKAILPTSVHLRDSREPEEGDEPRARHG